MNIFEEAYAGIIEARQTYNSAADEAGKKVAMSIYEEATKNVAELTGVERRIWRTYEISRDSGNEHLDISEPVSDGAVEELVTHMRKHGVEAFTFSSGWSDAVETAWLFQKAGCKLTGLVEINSQYTKPFSDEHEKTHGYLFRLN